MMCVSVYHTIWLIQRINVSLSLPVQRKPLSRVSQLRRGGRPLRRANARIQLQTQLLR